MKLWVIGYDGSYYFLKKPPELSTFPYYLMPNSTGEPAFELICDYHCNVDDVPQFFYQFLQMWDKTIKVIDITLN